MINTIKIGTSEHSIVPVLDPHVYIGGSENPLRLSSDVPDGNNYVDGLTIAIGSGLGSDPNGLFVYAQPPLVADQYGVELKLDSPVLEADYGGLTLRIGSGLTVDSYRNLSILLKNPAGPLSIDKGLELLLGPDEHQGGQFSEFSSLLADDSGLRLKLSYYTATPNSENALIGNAIASTRYGLSLRIGKNLIVDNGVLNVKLSFVTETSSSTASGERIPGNAIITVYDGGSGDDGVGNPGLSLRLHAREIDGSPKTLLTITDGGLDIDTEALKTVLGLS